MPEPLKHLYNEEMIAALADGMTSVYNDFDARGFCAAVLAEGWQAKELKERMAHISLTLKDFLPSDFEAAVEILKPISSRFNGFEYMFFPGFVELFGLEHFDASVSALECFTPFASSEFAVRPFIKTYGRKMMAQMEAWARSDNHHVRRLASEGCRPRLPWAMALPEFKKDPSPVLPILERLKDDDSEYVRRSVANNLNDIAKDHPQVVVEIAGRWKGYSPEVDGLVKHACRTLLKQGDRDVLSLFGFPEPRHIQVDGFGVQESVAMGDSLELSFVLKAKQGSLGKLRIEYAVDFLRSRGKRSKKVFQISESDHSGAEKVVRKLHSFKKISTRKYYPGAHSLTLIVNGHELATLPFELVEPS